MKFYNWNKRIFQPSTPKRNEPNHSSVDRIAHFWIKFEKKRTERILFVFFALKRISGILMVKIWMAGQDREKKFWFFYEMRQIYSYWPERSTPPEHEVGFLFSQVKWKWQVYLKFSKVSYLLSQKWNRREWIRTKAKLIYAKTVKCSWAHVK